MITTENVTFQLIWRRYKILLEKKKKKKKTERETSEVVSFTKLSLWFRSGFGNPALPHLSSYLIIFIAVQIYLYSYLFSFDF